MAKLCVETSGHEIVALYPDEYKKLKTENMRYRKSLYKIAESTTFKCSDFFDALKMAQNLIDEARQALGVCSDDYKI
jgi:hypothetical protein